MKNNEYENNPINKKIQLIVLWIILTFLSYNGNLIWLFTGKIERWINIRFDSILTLNNKILIDSLIDYLSYILFLIPVLMVIANSYIKINIMKYINIIVSVLYLLIYLVSFIYAIQVTIVVEILFYFTGLLITILLNIESIKIIIKLKKDVNKEEN